MGSKPSPKWRRDSAELELIAEGSSRCVREPVSQNLLPPADHGEDWRRRRRHGPAPIASDAAAGIGPEMSALGGGRASFSAPQQRPGAVGAGEWRAGAEELGLE